MSAPKKKRLTHRKGKIKLSQRVSLIEKNDKTRVARRDTIGQMPTKRIIPDNGATFKVKIRKK